MLDLIQGYTLKRLFFTYLYVPYSLVTTNISIFNPNHLEKYKDTLMAKDSVKTLIILQFYHLFLV